MGNETVETTEEQDVSRREFLTRAGAILAAVAGVGVGIKINSSSGSGYGESPYGGAK